MEFHRGIVFKHIVQSDVLLLTSAKLKIDISPSLPTRSQTEKSHHLRALPFEAVLAA